MRISFKGLWGFWLGCTVGCVGYGLFFNETLDRLASPPYWIAFTIFCIQFLGAGKERSAGDSDR
jgi:hypothetical protein